MIQIYKYDSYVFAGNGFVAYTVLEFLKQLSIECKGVVVHPDDTSKQKEKLTQIAKEMNVKVWNPSTFNDIVTEEIYNFKETLLISVYYGYIIPSDVIRNFKTAINLHPSYLPFNKGSFTNVWSIIDDTPAGISLHIIDENIDSGEIIGRKKVKQYSYDTGKTLYGRLESEAIEFFKSNIEEILSTDKISGEQNIEGTYHNKQDVDLIDEIKLDNSYTARELLNILRARTYDNYPSAYYIDEEENKKVFVRVQFEVDELSK